MRVCRQCGEEFLATAEFFHRDAKGRGGLRTCCKACDSERVSQWEQDKLEDLAGRPRPGICERCGYDNGGRSMHFDHDHTCCPTTPKASCGVCFRGWVCGSCNTSDARPPSLVGGKILYVLRSRTLHPSYRTHQGGSRRRPGPTGLRGLDLYRQPTISPTPERTP